jgi:hypothetical protein
MMRKLTGCKFSIVFLLLTVCVFAVTGCSSTQKAAVDHSKVNCAMLVDDCAKLQPGSEGQVALRYVNPNVDWTQYKKIMLLPVTFWGGVETKISVADQQAMTDFLHEQLSQQLSQKFEMTSTPGPGVIKMQVAITDVKTATPVLRTISMIVPQARAVATLQYLATGSFPFVGSAQAEAKLTDAATGQVLSELVDRKMGSGAVQTGFQWKWGDAENVMKDWAKKGAERLYSWTSGQAKP